MKVLTKLLTRFSKNNNNATNYQSEATNIRNKAYTPPSLNDPHAFGNTNGGLNSYYYEKYYPESCKADDGKRTPSFSTTVKRSTTTVRDTSKAKQDRQLAQIYYCRRTTEKFECNKNDVQEIRKRVKDIGCKLNDVTTIEKVREFENKHGVTLPDDYVWFITNVGDGGTWNADSHYSFYPLEKTEFSYEGLPNYKQGEEKYSLDVLSKGCSYSYGIILKGEHFGKISSNGDGLAFYHPEPINSFKELYLTWVNETYAGYTDFDILSRIPGRIEKLLEEYKHNHSYDYVISILRKANPQSSSPQFASDLYSVFVNEPAGENKMVLANILFKIHYSNIPAVIKNIYQPENYGHIIWCIHSFLNYFEDSSRYENVMPGAEIYYPTLLEILKYFYNALPDQEMPDFKKLDFSELDYEKCFNMVVMNPRFQPNDILELLTSDKPFIIKHMAFNYYDRAFLKNIKDRIYTYVDDAKVKYDQLRENQQL